MVGRRLQERKRIKECGWYAAGGRMARARVVVCGVLALMMMMALLAAVPIGHVDGATQAMARRRIAVDVRAGQSSFVVTVDSRRSTGTFPKGFTPLQVGTHIAFPMRAVLEAAGGVVRFEPSEKTVCFALGPVAGAYELGSRTLIDSTYTSSVRGDLLRTAGRTGTLYFSDDVLGDYVRAAGGTLTVSTRSGLTSIVLQIPSTMQDVLGYQHDTFPVKAGHMRIVALAPNLAENCFALGQGGNIIGTSEYTDYPEQATKIPTVGAFSSPSLEKLLVLSPDIILVTRGTPLSVVEQLRKMGRNVYTDDPQTLAGIVEAIRAEAVVLGVADHGFEVALSMHRSIEKAATAAKKLPRKPSVYVEIWNSPLMSAGKGTFLSDLIAVAGGTNIGDDTNTAWPVLSEEFVISHNPEIIIVASGMGAGDVTGRTAFATVTAVKKGQVYEIPGDYIFRPSPRIIQGLNLIAGYVQRAAQP